mmetsp:Transcript_41759/g.97852  ORF Transcript_41759/g.97852 Transcript_41759/m.97852 type:complete len:225 (+) Transcript_41759:3430-4104(+)
MFVTDRIRKQSHSTRQGHLALSTLPPVSLLPDLLASIAKRAIQWARSQICETPLNLKNVVGAIARNVMPLCDSPSRPIPPIQPHLISNIAALGSFAPFLEHSEASDLHRYSEVQSNPLLTYSAGGGGLYKPNEILTRTIAMSPPMCLSISIERILREDSVWDVHAATTGPKSFRCSRGNRHWTVAGKRKQVAAIIVRVELDFCHPPSSLIVKQRILALWTTLDP